MGHQGPSLGAGAPHPSVNEFKIEWSAGVPSSLPHLLHFPVTRSPLAHFVTEEEMGQRVMNSLLAKPQHVPSAAPSVPSLFS